VGPLKTIALRGLFMLRVHVMCPIAGRLLDGNGDPGNTGSALGLLENFDDLGVGKWPLSAPYFALPAYSI